ncbi:MAG: putative outer membrane protein precursor, OmpA family [Chitinophagaceae bacterium]|nr:putative outer membrane protein precursor, OmpA family [Chitinophagaceae bacterium]
MGQVHVLRLFFFAAAFVLSGVCHAQRDLVVDEIFSTNERFWPVGQLGYATVAMEKGKYTIDRTALKGESTFTVDNYINPSEDFSIETSFTILAADSNAAAGLVWNYVNEQTYDEFSISATGKYQVCCLRYGSFIDISGQVIHPSIKKAGQKNTLLMQRHGDSCSYSINDTKVFTTIFPGLAFSSHGFHALNKIKFTASSFIVKQQQTISQVESFKAKKETLGSAVNSALNDSAPLISPDGSVLFFIREPQASHTADIWMSTKDKQGNWMKSVNIGVPLNNKVFNSVISCSADHKSLLLLNTYNADGSFKGRGFSISRFNGTSWSVPQDVVIENLNDYGQWLDASLSPDNRTMLLSALRPETMGYNDLYVSFLNSNGKWSEPLNLGSTINTYFNEAAPFLAADNKTLYFSSVGYPGYGNQDIFMSKRLDDSWRNWSKPINLGPSVNTTGFDAFFSIAANENKAYLVSNVQSMGGTDIFNVELPPALAPEKVCLLSGKVLDNKTGAALEARLVYHSLNNENKKGSIVSDAKDGSYRIVLPDADSYYISADRKGYFAQADSVAFSGEENQSLQKELILRLDPLIIGKSLPIRQLYFEKTKAHLLPTSLPALDNLYQLMQQHPQLKISIEGHTDNVGDASLNQQLSLQRAKAVEQFLQQKGIEANRMTTIGYGGLRPIADNSKEETRRLNRRVEFTVLEY